MTISTWMIYGATGYSGRLIAEAAIEKGLRPVLAARSPDGVKQLATELGLECRSFILDDTAHVAGQLMDIDVLVNCAGPFSQTAEAAINACLLARTHYFDITGEIGVFEFAHSEEIDSSARQAGVAVCPGIGFDVIPTDCVALALAEALPDATELHLGFSGSMAVSPGTAKSMIEGLALGTKGRRNGEIVEIPLLVSEIDYGKGAQQSMSVSWGDVSTAWYTTGIPNITVSWPATGKDLRQARIAKWLRPIMRRQWVQDFLKKQVDRRVSGPGEAERAESPVHVWGQARNAAGDTVTARVLTANGYSVTADAPPLIIQRLMEQDIQPGSQTPAKLFGKDFICRVPGSGALEIS